MRKFLICVAVIMILMMLRGRATAVPFGDDGVALQAAFDKITLSPNPGVSSINVLTDELPDSMDSYWSIHGSGGSVSTLIVEVAEWTGTNTFGIYDAFDSSKKVPIFEGNSIDSTQALLSILSDGSVIVNFKDSGIDFAGNAFGYYVNSNQVDQPGGGLWYSDTSLNADGADHMAAYQGKGIDTIKILPFYPGVWDIDEFVLAFEDLHSMHWSNSNGSNPEWRIDAEPDFIDLVVMVESVDPVPEPATLLLLGLGLIGVAGLNKKRFMD